MYYPVTKSLLLLASAVACFYGTKPPVPPVDDKKAIYKGQGIFERSVRKIRSLWQIIFCGTILTHIAVMLSLHYVEFEQALPVGSLLQHICRDPSPSLSALSALTPTFLCGVALLIVGGTIRLWCYTTLGRHFTFEVTILDDHALVTSGPYAYVRHPAYTGACMVLSGTLIILCNNDGYVASCNMWNTYVGWLVHSSSIMGLYMVFAVLRRADVEDTQLKKNFGVKWEAYRREVPYKFVPYVR